MQQINLLDQRLLPIPHRVSGARLVLLASLGLAAVTVHLGIEQERMTRTQGRLNAAAQTEPTEPADAAGDTALRVRISQRQALRDVLARSQALPVDSARMLLDVIAALPEEIWLTEVDLVGTQGLRITGGALEPAALRAFADRLAGISTLKGIAVETLRVETDSETHGPQAGHAAAHSFVLVSAAYSAAEATR